MLLRLAWLRGNNYIETGCDVLRGMWGDDRPWCDSVGAAVSVGSLAEERP
jgi:hypothetical protein